MKLSWSFALSLLYCAAAASKAGHVFILDPKTKAVPQQSVTPETARLILAQRLGLSRFHSIKHANDHVIQQLNTYGGRSQRLFGGDNEKYPTGDAHLLVWIEDVEHIGAIIKDPSAYSAEFTISDPPSSDANDRLVRDLIMQAESLPKKYDPLGHTYATGIETEALLDPVKKVNTYKNWLSVLRADQSIKPSYAELSDALDVLRSKIAHAEEKGWPMTVVLMPPSSSHTKRNAQPYGTYDLPASIEARREKTEALLSPSSSQPSSESQSPNPDVSSLEDVPTIQQAEDSSILGILPKYFLTRTECEKRTNNCSGHGTINATGTRREGDDRKEGFFCACIPTVVTVGEDGMEIKHKTTYWGGPACQKKDVSQPFWLFVSSGIILAGLISAGIGMLYSMGSEELPSVIGAGVSGPVRK